MKDLSRMPGLYLLLGTNWIKFSIPFWHQPRESSHIHGFNADPSLSLMQDLVRLTAVAGAVITNDSGIRMVRASQGKVNAKCPPNVFLSMLESNLHIAFSHLRCTARLLKYILWFLRSFHCCLFLAKISMPQFGLAETMSWYPTWARRNSVRATVVLTLWQQVCEADSSVLGLGLKPPDSLHKLLYHMVAVLGTVGLKLNLWHEVKIKKKINPSVLHYRIPEASKLCACLSLYSAKRI